MALTDEQLDALSIDDIVGTVNEYFDGKNNTTPQEGNSNQSSTDDNNNYSYSEDGAQVNTQNNQGVENSQVAGNSTSATPNQDNMESDISRLFQPFKASGKEFQVRNIDEAISLMQKGVDYTQKQQQLKPRLAEMKTLDQYGMLGDNLNYAIDLFTGRPEAVAKLIRDKKLDVNQLMPSSNEFGETQETTTNYVPNNHKISEEQMQLSDVIDTLKANNSYDKVNTAVTKFDEVSQREFVKDPNKLLALQEHINSGLYDAVMNEIDHQKTIGNPALTGKTDFEVYTDMATTLLNYVAQQQQNQLQQQQVQTQPQDNPQYQQQVQTQQQYQQIQNRKASVAPNRGYAGNTSNRVTDFDPLHMSDKELESLDLRKFGNLKFL